jgi:hypothetical protein
MLLPRSAGLRWARFPAAEEAVRAWSLEKRPTWWWLRTARVSAVFRVKGKSSFSVVSPSKPLYGERVAFSVR